MRITRDALIKIARQVVQQRVYNQRDIAAAYLIGSVLGDNHLLGGTTDIDLVFVHETRPALPREIIALSNDVHLDLAYRARSDYDHPRALRIDPWLGHEVYDPLLLYDSNHFFEFVQASVRSQFEDPINVLLRARSHLEQSRKIWQGLQFDLPSLDDKRVSLYLNALRHAANAIAAFSGPPMPNRRLLFLYPARCNAVDRPELYKGLLGLLGGMQASREDLSNWMPEWQKAFETASRKDRADIKIQSARKGYYQRAILSFLESEESLAALWPLFYTWTLAISALEMEDPNQPAWQAACLKLGLGKKDFQQRIEGLDHYLDDVEETFEAYAASNGIQDEAPLDNIPYLGV